MNLTELKPCVLERRILPKVWGGRALESVLDLRLPPGEAIGETWELFDRPDGSSRLRGSEVTLRELMEFDSAGLLGRGVRPAPGGYFPLLLKYIDAADRLSVQVHPDDLRAREEGDSGKTEAWVVLHAGPDARIVCGLREGVSAEQLAAVAHTADVEQLLASHRPAVGDTFFVPAGTVHAIGPDVVVFEVQQNSDITYRLYDWGRPRETHLEKALEATRVGPPEPGGRAQIDADTEWLFRNPHFTTRRVVVRNPASLGTEGTFKTLSVVGGRGTLGWHSGGAEPPLLLQLGDTVLVPASTGVVFLSPIGAMTVLVCGPGVTR
ncbi:MAG: class I mannose-6-phosphate isomerase [Planctomycetes bacterium]|nr:class I mannose-6-phosphate isomerase [Planctomycetota bacterium]MCB9869020.1 class I mannose-6-phosphate isomerase [Planctomycetota bacterium]MCB9887980.1 class I mannose-6-phosphate isomerase [Planctomycetota bacterium]